MRGEGWLDRRYPWRLVRLFGRRYSGGIVAAWSRRPCGVGATDAELPGAVRT